MAKLIITCKACNFMQEVDDSRIPDGWIRVTCPQCKQVFGYKKPDASAATAGTGTSFQQASSDFSFTAPQSFRYAGFWIRLLAYIIDILFVLVVAFVVIISLLAATGNLTGPDPEFNDGFAGLAILLFGILAAGLFLVFYLTVSWCKWGKTIGMRITGIRVINYEGNNPTGSQAFLRWLTGFFLPGMTPYLNIIALLALGVMVGVHERKQGWHDLAAKTYVIHD